MSRVSLIAPTVGVALAAFLAGCSSPSTHYFTLAAVPSSQAIAHELTGAPLKLDPVTIPSELDRLQVVRRSDVNQVEVASVERWAGPLDEQIRHVLTEDLRQRLGPGRVLAPEAAAPPKDLRSIAVDVSRFDDGLDGHVVLVADWAAVLDGTATLRRNEHIEVDAQGPDVAASASAMSQALGELADNIATAMSGPIDAGIDPRRVDQ